MTLFTRGPLPRRTFLRGLGATVALPYLEAMVPVFRSPGGARGVSAAADKTRLICIESVHGAAGSNAWGATKNLWAPAVVGRDFELIPEGALPSLEALEARWQLDAEALPAQDRTMADALHAKWLDAVARART